MPPSNRYSPHRSHTIVLKPRGIVASRTQIYGSKQGHFVYARGSPPLAFSGMRRKDVHPPPRQQSLPPQKHIEDSKNRTDLLVRFGIDSTLGRVVSRILILLMLTQPIYVALGMELEDGTVTLDTQEEAPVIEEVEEPVVEEVEEVEEASKEVFVSEDEELHDEDLDVDTDISLDTEDVVEEEEVLLNGDDVIEASSDEDSSDNEHTGVVLGDATDEGGVDETTGTISDDELTDEIVAVDDEDSGTDVANGDETESDDEASAGGSSSGSSGGNVQDDEVSEEVAEEITDDTDDVIEEDEVTGETADSGDSSVSSDDTEGQDEEVVAENEEGIIAVDEEDAAVYVSQNPNSKYVFGEGDCTLVSDGEFYCIAEGPERQVMLGDPRVYAEKDREGDKEIYYFDGVEVRRITNNSYDDFAPVFDEETMRIVWQAMLNDRLQIMMYEIPTNTTRQITTSRQNSSNPSIAGDLVVWQEWIDTNWEIMMTDVNNNGQAFEIERLTDNAVHDMFPAAYEGLITWQSERGSSWEVIVYDLRTGQKHALEKDEDTKYENPRFVLLFDSKHENGDVETIGYNLDTGEMMELGTTPAPIPTEPLTPKDETPDAVVREASNSPQVRIETDDSGSGDGGDGGDGTGTGNNVADVMSDTATTTDAGTVVLSPVTVVPSETVQAVDESAVIEVVTELEETVGQEMSEVDTTNASVL